MAVRNKRQCRNCPEGLSMVTQPQAQTPVLHITSDGEGERLWKHVLFGTGAYVNMIEGYCRLGVPGLPVEALHTLVTRMQEVLKKIEPPIEESRPKSERRKPKWQEMAQEERPSDEPLSAEYVVNDERDAE